jgi:zinc and cadmium transporter
MEILLWILLITFIDGLAALVGAFSFVMKGTSLKRIITILVAFAAGTLLSGAFFHLMPEALASLDAMTAFVLLMTGFAAFFIIERFLHWHHCHDGKCDVHPFSYLILYGDAVHNFIDGLVIAASFLANVPLGIVTSLVIICHEVPQELGNFGILVYGGFSKKKAVVYSFLVQLTSVMGGLVGYFLSATQDFTFLLPFAAGGFIYIAASDLIPELHKEPSIKKSVFHFGFFAIGVLFMLAIKLFVGA